MLAGRFNQTHSNETKRELTATLATVERKEMPRQPKFMLEANPRLQPSEMKRIPVTAIGKRNLSLARILHIRRRSLSGVGNCHWHANKILGMSLCTAGGQSFKTWRVESWQQRQSNLARRGSLLAQGKGRWLTGGSWTVRQLQAVWLETGQKRTRYSFFSLQE